MQDLPLTKFFKYSIIKSYYLIERNAPLRQFLSTISIVLISAMLAGAFASCSSNTSNTEPSAKGETTIGESELTSEAYTTENETYTTESVDHTTESKDHTNESESQGEETTTGTNQEVAIPELPSFSKSMITGDGSAVSFGEGISNDDYLEAISYFISNGFSQYSADTVGNSKRATFTKGDEYYTLVYNSKDCELTMVYSESGALSLPTQWNENSAFKKLCDTSITQHYSSESSGMGYIFRLEDGSFIVYDGGYKSDAKDFLLTLSKLNLNNKIHVRAWIITHDHSDHYAAFNEIAKSYAKRLKIDYVMYSPTTSEEATVLNYYKEQILTDVANFSGAKLISVHAGMTFNILNVKLEILQTPSMLSIHGKLADFNDTSIISRIVSADGSAIMLADACGRSADWLVRNIGDGLKSDIVQVAHHGVETGSIPLYDAISAPMAFWPCDSVLFASQRGEKIKQHIIEAEYSIEHVLHSYGTVTRKLSYRPIAPEAMDIMPTQSNMLSTDVNGYATDARIDNGVLKFDITDPTDPFVVINFENVDMGNKNLIRMVVDAADAKDGYVYVQTNGDTSFTAEKSIIIGNQGKSIDGKTTYLIYLGNITDIEDGIKSLRIDLGSEAGQTVAIYSIEISHLDLSHTE